MPLGTQLPLFCERTYIHILDPRGTANLLSPFSIDKGRRFLATVGTGDIANDYSMEYTMLMRRILRYMVNRRAAILNSIILLSSLFG